MALPMECVHLNIAGHHDWIQHQSSASKHSKALVDGSALRPPATTAVRVCWHAYGKFQFTLAKSTVFFQLGFTQVKPPYQI